VAPGNNRLLTIGAAAGSVALLAAAMFMLWPSDPTDLALPAGREQADGETVGWVSKVEANTIHVNSGPFGGGVMPLVVTKETRITIGTKEAWFEDIRPGGQVKVAYELYRGRRLARTVELLVDEGPRRPARPEARVKNAVSSGLLDRAPAKASATAGPAPQTRPAPEAGGAAPAAESAAKDSGLARPAAPARRGRPGSGASIARRPSAPADPPCPPGRRRAWRCVAPCRWTS